MLCFICQIDLKEANIFPLQLSSAQYIPQIDDMVYDLNQRLDMYISAIENMFFYQIYDFQQRAAQLGNSAASAADRQAADHIIRARSNYTNIAYTVAKVFNDTRDALAADVKSKKDVVMSRIPEITEIARELNQILRNRNCSNARINDFFTELFTEISQMIQLVTNEASSSYVSLIMRDFIPYYLFTDLFSRFENCLYPYHGTGLSCLLRVSFYKFAKLWQSLRTVFLFFVPDWRFLYDVFCHFAPWICQSVVQLFDQFYLSFDTSVG